MKLLRRLRDLFRSARRRVTREASAGVTLGASATGIVTRGDGDVRAARVRGAKNSVASAERALASADEILARDPTSTRASEQRERAAVNLRVATDRLAEVEADAR